MTSNLRKRLLQIGSFVLAAALLILALRGVDFQAVGQDLRDADYRWLVPLIVVTLLSHWLRGWRWTMFLSALPDSAGPGKSVTTSGAFGAVLIGYLANYVAPRVGEFVRTANISARYRVRFPAVLGTVTAERALDVFAMALALISVPLLLRDRIPVLRSLLLEPLQGLSVPWIPILLGAALAMLLLVVLWVVLRRRRSEAGEQGRLTAMLGAFSDGMLALVRSPRRAAILVSTVGIWLCYALMAYIPFLIFGLHDAYTLGFGDAWALMLLGAIGVVIPSPGGIGTYHYITIQSLVLLWGVPQDAAASYALLSHTGQMVLYVIAGAAAMVVQGVGFRSVAKPDIPDVEATDARA